MLVDGKNPSSDGSQQSVPSRQKSSFSFVFDCWVRFFISGFLGVRIAHLDDLVETPYGCSACSSPVLKGASAFFRHCP